MVHDATLWEQFEAEWQRRQKPDLEVNLRVFEVLLEHARALGAWPPRDPLEGIEHDIRLAKVVNTYVEKPADLHVLRSVEGG